MITNVECFIPKLKEMYPQISEQDIRRAVNFGWRRFYFYNLRNLDILVTSLKNHYWFYCGNLTTDSIKHFRYYCKMLSKKFRVLYKYKDNIWDGCYYFGLNEDEYKELTKISKGRKRKYFTFNKKICYKILDEARVSYHWAKAIVKIKLPENFGYSFYKLTGRYENPELVEVREKPLTFKDILITSNNYDLI